MIKTYRLTSINQTGRRTNKSLLEVHQAKEKSLQLLREDYDRGIQISGYRVSLGRSSKASALQLRRPLLGKLSPI